MKIQINITKSHLFLLSTLILLLISTITLGQTTTDFGHSYEELDLRGKITSLDIESTTYDEKTYVNLNVLRSRIADNALAARCDLKIIECAGNTINNPCQTGKYQTQGWFSFSGSAQDSSATCSSNGKMALCCQGI